MTVLRRAAVGRAHDLILDRGTRIVTFVNAWEVSAPFLAPLDPTNTEWMRHEQEPFVSHETRFGLLDVRAIYRGADLGRSCVLARSAQPLVGRVLLGADDLMYVYDQGAIIARDLIPSNVHWPETTLDFVRPTRLRLMLCNLGRELAVQAAVRR